MKLLRQGKSSGCINLQDSVMSYQGYTRVIHDEYRVSGKLSELGLYMRSRTNLSSLAHCSCTRIVDNRSIAYTYGRMHEQIPSNEPASRLAFKSRLPHAVLLTSFRGLHAPRFRNSTVHVQILKVSVRLFDRVSLIWTHY